MSTLVLTVASKALERNPLGDPHVRKLPLIVPDDLAPGEAVPCVWWLAGYAGVGASMLSHDPWTEGLEERVERLRAAGQIGKLIVALPDAFTAFGGSQYLSSSAHGDYERYLQDDLRAAVESRFTVAAHAIAGKSSGGYGALVHAMRRPDLYRAVACHSGDMGFELAYLQDVPDLMNAVRDHGGVEAFFAAFQKTRKKKEGRWMGPIGVLAMCAAYSPDPSKPLGVELPFDLERGEIDWRVFERWLEHDPVRMIDEPEHQEALRRSRLVYLDCGTRDEHHLHWGARAFARKLREAGIPHVHEEFEDGHRSTSYRLDVSLPRLYAALA